MSRPRVDAIAKVRIGELTLPATGFEAYTYARYRSLLSGGGPPESAATRLAVAAWAGEIPIGLAFLSRAFDADEGQTRQLLSIMVTPFMRRQGIGTRLLAAVQQLAADRGTSRLLARHSSRMAKPEAFESLIARAGWKAPVAFEYRLAGKASWALQTSREWAPFLERLHKAGFAVSDWSAIGDGERAQISTLFKRHRLPDEADLDPFLHEAKIQAIPEISIVLRRHGDIVGWIIGQRGLLPDTFHYSSGYVVPALRRAGWLIGGVREVCQRQAEHFGDETVGVFETAASNHAMRRFMDRHLKPYSLWTDARYRSEKVLTSAPDDASQPPAR